MPAPDGGAIAPLHPSDKRKILAAKRTCARCKSEKSSIVLQTATFCHQCFQNNFEGKVHHIVEQSRLCTYLHRTEEDSETASNNAGYKVSVPSSASTSAYPCKGRIAIAFSGGAASRALLHVAKNRLLPKPNDPRNGRRKLQEVEAIDVIYVEQCAVIAGSQDRTEDVRAIVEEEGGQAEGLHFCPVKLEDVFDDDGVATCSAGSAAPRIMSSNLGEKVSNKHASLQSLFASVQPSNTPRGMLANARSRAEDLTHILVRHLLRREAIERGASCLLTGQTSTRKAIQTIDSIGKGRGHKLPVEDGSIRWNGLFMLQPMKEVTAKEVMLYSRSRRLHSIPSLDYTSAQLLGSPLSLGGGIEGGNGDKASMSRLTESLIHLLEKNVASTISTVNKVGDKLVFADDPASHGFTGDEDDYNVVDTNASSSYAFRQVGPSVPLRLRKKRQEQSDMVSAQFSNLSITSKPKTPGGPGDRSLAGLGLGRSGSTLYLAAQKMLPYNGARACPLCQMPSQRGLHAWKRGLTIRSASEEVHDSNRIGEQGQLETINLTDLLCYACTIVLDTPENVAKDATMCLPSFVLKGAKRRLMERTNGPSWDGEEDTMASTALLQAAAKSDEAAPRSRGQLYQKPANIEKLDRAQMKRHLNGFLLADDEENVNSNKMPGTSEERKQTDW